MTFTAESLRNPANWRGRLVLFAVYPLAAVVLAFALTLVLLLAWPACLLVHKVKAEPL